MFVTVLKHYAAAADDDDDDDATTTVLLLLLLLLYSRERSLIQFRDVFSLHSDDVSQR